jgi:predicted RNA-binding protein with PUA domain
VVGYIGGNSFLEVGFAHVLNKKIFLFNEIPDCLFKDELIAMQPIILGEDLKKIN